MTQWLEVSEGSFIYVSCTWYRLSAASDGNTYVLPLHVARACLQLGDSKGDISRKRSR